MHRFVTLTGDERKKRERDDQATTADLSSTRSTTAGRSRTESTLFIFRAQKLPKYHGERDAYGAAPPLSKAR